MDFRDIFSGSPTPAKWKALGDFLMGGAMRGGNGVRVRQLGNRTIVSAKRQKPSVAGTAQVLQFEISTTATSLVAAPGVVDGSSRPATIEEDPADGTWYLEAKVSINSTTGDVTARSAQWASSPSSNTTTDFFSIIGTVEVTDGVPDPGTIDQYTYGPMVVIIHGKYAVPFGAIIF